MNDELVKAWLKRTLATASAWKLVAVVGCLLTGVLVLFISFWVSYGVIWFISHSFYPLTHRAILFIDGGFMALVVIVGARQNWDSLDPLQQQAHLAHDMDITLAPSNRYGMSYNTDAAKAGAFEVRSMASVINCVLCGGVMLVLMSVGKLREFRCLKQIDVDGCARVMALLSSEAKRQSFTQIVQKLPGLNPVKVFEDLHFVDGILFLSNEPPGLTLLPELRNELNGLSRSA